MLSHGTIKNRYLRHNQLWIRAHVVRSMNWSFDSYIFPHTTHKHTHSHTAYKKLYTVVPKDYVMNERRGSVIGLCFPLKGFSFLFCCANIFFKNVFKQVPELLTGLFFFLSLPFLNEIPASSQGGRGSEEKVSSNSSHMSLSLPCPAQPSPCETQ